MKYYAEITGWGDEAKAFLKELNYIILFNDNAQNLLKYLYYILLVK